MPGIVVFKRRWSMGSDDMFVPAVFLVVLHLVWVVALAVILGVVHFDPDSKCGKPLQDHVIGYIVIMCLCGLVEGVIAVISMRGSILFTEPRNSMQYLLYIRLVLFVVEIVWLTLGMVWVCTNYSSCKEKAPKRAVLGIIVCNWLIMLSVFFSLWCTFDTAGRSWVKMKRYQESIKEREQRAGHKRRSGSRRRNWRHSVASFTWFTSCMRHKRKRPHNRDDVDGISRKVMRTYEQSWNRRCGVLFCCVREDRHQNSFSEVAKLFTEFFRDLDVVPTDVIAGLVLLRRHQKVRRKFTVEQGTNDVYQFLSGVPITPATRFLSLRDPDVLNEYKRVVYYMRYALAAYGWPMYMMMNTGTGLCKIMPYLNMRKCGKCMCTCSDDSTVLVEDNCCECNYAAMRKLGHFKNSDLIYVTYHVDIGETPFFVAVDHDMKTVVISIRGTLSLQDVLTDLKADAEQIPVEPIKEEWLGHKGMVQAAVYIRKKIKDEMLLSRAFGRDLDKGTHTYDLVLVGHSLGAGTAAILAILLHQEYPNLQCYAYSPPGGLLSAQCVEDTKSFITSVVVGKDVVPRIGLHQLEAMRQDLINVIKKSTLPKWRIILGSMMCCGDYGDGDHNDTVETYHTMQKDKEIRNFQHPTDSQIALTTHTPLYIPGKIIHVVRNHPPGSEKLCSRVDPVYQAIYADNLDFGEVLISPTMVNDHMPDKVMAALEKVLVNIGPAKPKHKLPEAERKALLSESMEAANQIAENEDTEAANQSADNEDTPQIEPYMETSFNTDQPVGLRSDISIEDGLESSANSLSWDYVELEKNHRQSVEQNHHQMSSAERAERSKSFPLPSEYRAERPRNMRLDLSVVSTGHLSTGDASNAPLATPETLSECSSIDSESWRGSRKSRNGDSMKRCTGGAMPTIQQSPLRSSGSKTDGYQYFIPAPSPVEYCESPEREFKRLAPCVGGDIAQPVVAHPLECVQPQIQPMVHSMPPSVFAPHIAPQPLAQSTPLKYTTEAQVERSASASSLEPTDGATLDSIQSDYTALDSTNLGVSPLNTPDASVNLLGSPDASAYAPDASGFIDDSMPRELSSPDPRGVTPPKPPRVGLDFTSLDPHRATSPGSREQFGGSPGVAPLSNTGSRSDFTDNNDVTNPSVAAADLSVFNLTDEEAKLRGKINNMASPDNYKLTFPGNESMCQETTPIGGDGSFETRDFGGDPYVRHSPDEYGQQVGYDPLLGHYSHGGRGYPHGAYISPSPSAHGEDDKELAAKCSQSSQELGAAAQSDLPRVHHPSNVQHQPLVPSGGQIQHCDQTPNSRHGNGINTGRLLPSNSTQIDSNSLDTQQQQHNGLNVARESDILTTTAEQPLLSNNLELINAQNSFSDNERDLLLPSNNDAESGNSSRGAFIVNSAGPSDSVV